MSCADSRSDTRPAIPARAIEAEDEAGSISADLLNGGPLEAGEEAQARSLLASWLQVDASTLPRQELVRHVIECSAISAHRHVFGVVVWFSVLAALGLGPIGAVIYRLGMELPRWWAGVGQPQDTNSSPDGHLSEWALWAWKRIDWLPARMTAVTFDRKRSERLGASLRRSR